jgi:hypothetical protein
VRGLIGDRGMGRLKVVSCLEALRRMYNLGVLELPLANPHGGYHPIELLSAEDVGFVDPKREIVGSVWRMGSIHFELVNGKKKERLWRYLIRAYHYLGYRRGVGRYLKYLVYLDEQLKQTH